MSLPFILFFVLAFIAVAAAVALILAREPIHSALSLILVMISLAVLYLLLGAEFMAAVQIIVYAGAIMVLFVFVIMLLNFPTFLHLEEVSRKDGKNAKEIEGRLRNILELPVFTILTLRSLGLCLTFSFSVFEFEKKFHAKPRRTQRKAKRKIWN